MVVVSQLGTAFGEIMYRLVGSGGGGGGGRGNSKMIRPNET